jgi:4-hydroxybutyrate CoA-transferase
MPQVIAAEDVPGLLRSGMTVAVQGTTGEPVTLLKALQAAPEASAGVRYVGCLIPGVNRIDPAGFHPEARLSAFFVGPELAESFAAGRVDFLPLSYSGIDAYLDGLSFDLGLIQLSPPDAGGRCGFGASVAFAETIAARSQVLVAEINRQNPALPGSPHLPYARLDYVVQSDRPLVEYATGDTSATMARIAENVAALVEDGACLQIGLGRVPSAVLARLHDRRDLGVHSGIITDEAIELCAAGAVTGARKAYEPGRIVTGAAFGTRRLYDWVAGRDDVLMRPTRITHDLRLIAGLDGFTAINSAVSVDLFGQVNAEMVGGRQVSGCGGLPDFARGARLSRGGKAVIALPATASGGKGSRIVPRLGTDAVVTCGRGHVDYVVTEHGVAHLSDKPISARAEALIGIADPAFRDELAEAWARIR